MTSCARRWAISGSSTLTPSSPNTPEAAAGGRGRLILVVGPSGVGKDTLIDGARAALAGDGRFVFARRWITRPAEAGGEDHLPVSEAVFAAEEAAGGFLLSWRAHGLCYGVPKSYGEALASGRHVIANVSRGVIDDARARLQPVRVVSISASADALRTRLSARGRETAPEIEDRIARAQAFQIDGADVVAIRNDGGLAEGIQHFLEELRAV